MELTSADASRETNLPITAAAELLTLSSICPACGYPSLGKGLCAYCKPLWQQAS
jgi:hypothetical protein